MTVPNALQGTALARCDPHYPLLEMVDVIKECTGYVVFGRLVLSESFSRIFLPGHGSCKGISEENVRKGQIIISKSTYGFPVGP